MLSDKGARKAKKLGLLYGGPYVITGIKKTNAYLLKRVQGAGRLITINARQLRPYKEPYLATIPNWEPESTESESD